MKKLPCGTVAFEDISSESYQGKVIKPVVHKQSPRGPPDGQLSGVIEYNSGNDTKEVLYGERDTEGEISLRKADTVEFNISTGKSFITPISQSIKVFNLPLVTIVPYQTFH